MTKKQPILFWVGDILNLASLPLAMLFCMVLFGMQKTQAQSLKPVNVIDAGEIAYDVEYKEVDRAEVLEKFLEKYESPLIPNVKTFIETADKIGVDYRLLPAISCMESTCGIYLIPASFNPFGWGGGYIYFESFDAAIEGVGEGLEKIYLSRGLDTVEEIGPVYTPPNYGDWIKGVRSFMGEMDRIALEI